MNKLVTITIGVGAILALFLTGLVGKFTGRTAVERVTATKSERAIEDALRQGSNEVNLTLPSMVDKDTRLDSTYVGPGKKWTYTYTLMNLSSTQISEGRLHQALSQKIKATVCSTKELLQDFVSNGVQVTYKYYGNDHKLIGDVIVNPSDCQPSINKSSPPARTSAELHLADSTSVTINTDVFQLTIDLAGGDISTAKLKTYAVSESNTMPVALIQRDNAQWTKVQSGLIAQDGVAPNHLAMYVAPSEDMLSMIAGQNVLEIPFTWTDVNGVTVRKIYHLERGSFVIGVRYEVLNNSNAAMHLFPYRQLQHGELAVPDNSVVGNQLGATYVGIGLYSPDEGYKTIPSDSFVDAPLKKAIVGGWIALLQPNFMVCWIPDDEEGSEYTTSLLPATATSPFAYLIRQTAAPSALEVGATSIFSANLYVGPKQQRSLSELAPGLGQVIE